MEFYSSWFFTAVSINVLNFYNLWNILYNFNKPVNLVNLNDVDKFLLEEFCESNIHFLK